MIVKKLLARFINDKIIQNAEHIYVASAAISDSGFDLIMSRLHPKCHVDIMTGLDQAVSPTVLRKILKEYHNRVALRVLTRAVLHANVYLFDMPYRKQLAFISSGTFTKEGFADDEELSYRVSNEKEMEELHSWFTRNYEESDDLTEKMIEAYEPAYHRMAEREQASRDEKAQWKEQMDKLL
ncbi:MAG: hypothetical protein HOP08_19720 [Cyclobacteriaceae bacterium]|nr:hypothetical protein [Cyclobacteriaceae bacterium]